jgi:hypothetical protein
MNLAKLPMRDASYTLEFLNPLAIKYRPSVAVAKAPDHSSSIARIALYVKHTTRGIKGEARGPKERCAIAEPDPASLTRSCPDAVAMRIAHRHPVAD